MKPKYLLPSHYKIIGWIIFIPALILGLYTVFSESEPEFLYFNVPAFFPEGPDNQGALFGMVKNNLFNEISGVIMIIGSILVAFSKEPDEDELISTLRLESLMWATYWNYGLMLLAFLLIYDSSFYTFMIFNMYTILLLFIIKFNWSIWKLRKSVKHEE